MASLVSYSNAINCFSGGGSASIFPYPLGSTTSTSSTEFRNVDYQSGTGVVACGSSLQSDIKVSLSSLERPIMIVIDDNS